MISMMNPKLIVSKFLMYFFDKAQIIELFK